MKAKKETTLFKVLTGSHLYGTDTETSDFDYKAVCLPPLDELLLNTKITNRKEKPEGLSSQDKMLPGETETEYLPLQVFMNDFFDGQTYALEVAFAFCERDRFKKQIVFFPDDTPLGTKVFVSDMMDDLIFNYLTKSVKKMVGYAVSQSKMYGLKTQRYTSMSDALKILEDCLAAMTFRTKDELARVTLDFCPTTLDKLLSLPHVKSVQLLNASGGTELAPGIEICGKQYPLTNRIVTIIKSLEKVVGTYGHRVKEFDGEGVDWKALSHAIRITEQVIELCTKETLTFPRPNAEFLLDVKSGRKTLDEATEYLNNAFSNIDDVIAASKLQERTPELEADFRLWKLLILRKLYGVT